MKKALLVLVMVSVMAVCAGTATASYFLTYNQAKRETREFVKAACGRINACTGSAVGKCFRNTPSNLSCAGALFFEYRGEEEECARLFRWGVNSRGYIAFRGFGAQHCFPA